MPRAAPASEQLGFSPSIRRAWTGETLAGIAASAPVQFVKVLRPMRSALFLWFVIVSAALAAAPAFASSSPELGPATESLRLSIEDWKREDAAYRSARHANKIPRAEQETYAGYVASLRLRVLQQCEVVRGLGGEAAVAPFECVRTTPEEQQMHSAVVPPAAVLTDEEKKATVQARLRRLEEEIDEDLLKRQQEIRQTAAVPRRPLSSASGLGGGGGGGGSGSTGGGGGSGSAGGGAQANTSAGTWSDPEAKQAGQGASGDRDAEGSPAGGHSRPQGAAGPNDRDRPAAARQRPSDGAAGDDIVARQLREAAEKETDPVLKEKLWAEYRKYKEAKK